MPPKRQPRKTGRPKSFYCPPDLDAKLAVIAKEEGYRSTSELMVGVLYQWIEQYEKRQKPKR